MRMIAFVLTVWRAATRNLGIKVLSVVIAIAAFAVVQGERDAQRSIFVDVVKLMPAPDAAVMLVSSVPEQVKVTLRGSRSRINALSREDIDPVQMNLSDSSRRYYYFDLASFDVPLGVSVVQVEPATVPLSWAQVAERQVPVRAHVTGQPRDGLQVKQPIAIVPSRVTIHGPALEVQSVGEVETELITIDGLEAGQHNRRIPLERPPSHITYVEDFEVQVRIDVVPEIAERLLVRLEVAALGVGEFAVRPAVVDVALRGPARVLAALDPAQVVPFVDLQGSSASVGNQPFKIELRGLPESVTAVHIVPSEVLVRRKR